jgi:serine protease Do
MAAVIARRGRTHHGARRRNLRTKVKAMNVENTGNKHRSIASAFMLGMAFVAVAGVAGYTAARATDTPPPLSVPFSGKQLGFAPLVKTVKPAVVNIATTQRAKTSEPQASDDEQEMLRQFFGQGEPQRPRERAVHALGSGFIIDPNGYIVTNNHVIDGATDIQVTLTDGSVHPARIVGRDVKTDLALLKIVATNPLPYVAFGDSDKEEVGDFVIAVGNPFGLGGSVSSGIVSARNRDINEGPYDDFLQIDAPINPGNSGGPLFDQSGHVIGIDTAIYSPSGGSVGIGFAIPSNVAKRVVAELREHGHVARGWLGVQVQVVTPEIANSMGLDKAEGVLVAAVTPGSPAARAGLRRGDVVLSFNGTRIAEARDLSIAVADTAADRTVDVKIWRDGQVQVLDATIGAQGARA